MDAATAERTTEKTNQDFAALMEDMAAMEPQQQEKLLLFVQGYVTAATGLNQRDKAAI